MCEVCERLDGWLMTWRVAGALGFWWRPVKEAPSGADWMKAGMPAFQLLKRGSVNVNGVECPLLEIQSGGPEGRLLQAMTAYVIKGKTAFTLTASQMAGLPYSEVRKEYLAIFNSVKLV